MPRWLQVPLAACAVHTAIEKFGSPCCVGSLCLSQLQRNHTSMFHLVFVLAKFSKASTQHLTQSTFVCRLSTSYAKLTQSQRGIQTGSHPRSIRTATFMHRSCKFELHSPLRCLVCRPSRSLQHPQQLLHSFAWLSRLLAPVQRRRSRLHSI